MHFTTGGDMFRFYLAVAVTAFRRQLIYRWANLAGLLTNIFFGAIFSYLIIALYHARPVVAGYDVLDTVRYTWLVQAMIMVMLPFGWYDLMQTIPTGEVITDLSKPCDFYLYWFSREIGRACYYLLFRGIPTYTAGTILFNLGFPGNTQTWLAFALTMPLGAMLGIAYRYLYNIVAFWLIEARAVATLAGTIALFFTGSFVPLPFFPPWLRNLALWLPFSGLMNVPAETLLGKIIGGSLWLEVARQVAWLILLTCLVRWITAHATKRVIVQGG
jgi:ABC-2 type transport system permease protein